ncbi:serine/threonine protein kinase [Rhodococcus oxybenzonivorans]|uniref:non-specific serine/threonine protein kinase n=1 Tax=Rhodococcus oxybenzonivorans TaxID=1990687 RepID=A0A2S2BT63_9NOCA|nr:protein kinase [Rhodococcus oxybenzonivorans]AWK71764.1 serine/threonine protein kinase [Rhodococcus oxybenzonivorans]
MSAPQTLAARYELRTVLGRGGMADVHDGWDLRLGRPVAVKVLRPEYASIPDIRRRFEVEARMAATLNHPNVVAVHDCGEDAGVAYIVMERLPGRTLADDIARGPLPEARARAILADILAAVGAAHDCGILHRDIKPANVLFSSTGVVKVADFGIAKSADSGHTTTGQVLGTVAYLSPDRIAEKPATVADDLYAVGVVGYEALAGHRPFVGENILSLARAILAGGAPPLSEVRPDLDPGLMHTVEKAMAHDPAHRFSDAAAMRNAILGNAGRVTAPTPMGAPPRTMAFAPTTLSAAPLPPADPRRPRKTGLILAAIAAVVVAVIVGALAIASQNNDGGGSPAVAPETSSQAPTPLPTPTGTGELPVAPPVSVGVPVPVPPAQNPELPNPNGNSGNGNGNNGGNGNNKDKEKDKENGRGGN